MGHAVGQLEVELGEGPCSRSFVAGAVVAAPDLEAVADEYPRFVPRALELIDPTEAFERLRRHARAERAKITDVADDGLGGRLDL